MAALISSVPGGDDISSMMLGRGTGMSFDISTLRSYLASLLSPGRSGSSCSSSRSGKLTCRARIVMAATRTDLESSLFGDLAFEDKAERFATDGSHMVAYITKERNLRAEEDDGEEHERDGEHSIPNR